MIKKLFFLVWTIAILALFLYSFTQIDLSLTFSRLSIWQILEKWFQNIGWFNRPLSSLFYEIILGLLCVMYGWGLYLVHKKKLERKEVWILIIATSLVLLFSYNAFSYDIFNYIFDAKIITHYSQNPYIHKALDFPSDPMLSFMRWTHRTYPYGPAWLALTVPLSYLGLGIFSFTFFIFKALMAASFLGCVYYIEKISSKTKVIDPLFAIVFFAFNPLIIIESLVSAHNDIVMIFFALLSISLMFDKKYIKSFTSILVSAGIKFATGILIIPMIYQYFSQKKKENNFELLFWMYFFSMFTPLYFVISRTQFQPWYILYLLPFAAFLSKRFFILIPTFCISFFSLLQYLPYIERGNWDPPVPTILLQMSYAGIISSIVLCVVWFLYKKAFKK